MAILKRADGRTSRKMESRDELIERAGKIAELVLDIKARELRKAEPHLSKEQAYARVFAAPENLELRRAERQMNGFRDYSKRALTDVSEPGQVDFSKRARKPGSGLTTRLRGRRMSCKSSILN